MSGSSSDAEFRELFAQESSQRLGRLQKELLEIETGGSTEELVSSIFRDAHTLKGAAAVLAFEDVARVAQAMEDVLDGVRNHLRPVSAELVDVMLLAVDELGSMVAGVLAGEDRATDADRVELRLRELADGTPPLEIHRVRAVSTPAVVVPPAASRDEAVAPLAPVPLELPVAPHAGVLPSMPPEQPAPPTSGYPRVLGDTVIVPSGRLDELIRLVGETAAAQLRLGAIVEARFSSDPSVVSAFRDLTQVLHQLQERTMQVRMVPLSTITDSLRRAVRDAARSLGKEVHWEVRGGDTELDRGVLRQISDPLMHLLRNAVDHGIEAPLIRVTAGKPAIGTVRVHAMQLGAEVVIAVSDDGGGIDLDQVRSSAAARGLEVDGLDEDRLLQLIFRPGVSTAERVTELSGRGVGLDVVRAGVEAVRGRVEVHAELGKGTEFRLVVPITLAVLPCMLVESAGQRYAIPMHSVMHVQTRAGAAVTEVEGRTVLRLKEGVADVFDLAQVLWGVSERPPESGYLVVLSVTARRDAFIVERLIGQRDVVVKNLGGLLPRFGLLAGASVEPDGSILLVLDAQGLIDSAAGSGKATAAQGASAPDVEAEIEADSRSSILIVDDALTVRELERSILERAGYDVRVAGDGAEALARLAEARVDLVLTDLEMPLMDGFALTEAIRADHRWGNLPVLILTSRSSDEDRRRGLEAGADGYIVKSAFDEGALLAAIVRVLGPTR